MHPTVQTYTLVTDYKRKVEQAIAGLPRQQRRTILEDIDAHLDEALSPGATDSEVREVLARLGDADAIAAAAVPDARRATPGTAVEIWALVMLTAGSIVLPVIGWVAGLVLLWRSVRWTTRDKVLGTLVWPGGMHPLWILLTIPSGETECVNSACTTRGFVPPAPVGITMLVILLGAPVAVLTHLWRRLQTAA